MWFMTGWDKVGDYGKKEPGRSAKEKPSHKGWAFMCNISLLALRGRLFQPPVVCLQVSKITPGLGSGSFQLRHVLR